MEQFSLRNLVNKYIDDEKKRNKNMRSKSAIYKWIIDDVRDILVAINDDFREINNDDTNAKKKFRAKIIGEFETKYFKNFLKNKSETADYYDKLLNDCLIHIETIEDFLNPENNSKQNPKTLDFFIAFCKYQEREYGQETSTSITRQKHQISTDVKIETLQISGAIIINEEFIDNIKKQEFSMAEFYTAKQNENCQWYGILYSFDVIRKDYIKIKNIVIKSFKEQSSGISSIIYGSGGCGKSTLLRRLAIELSLEETQKPLQKQIKIVWLNDNGFEDFYSKGLSKIEQSYGITFLIIIEDWYRITEHDKEIAYKFLKKADSFTNMRIVVGDRIVEKKCKDLLDGEPILLSPDENESIIETIIENNKEWEEIADQLFADKNNYQCSLFLLLFIMAYANQNKNTLLNFSKPQKAFIDIIENDLKVITNAEDKKYKGLAKALYYWACIYEKHRIFISYDTFLVIADHYNENKLISKYFSRWNMEDPVLDKLKTYINKNYSLGKYSDKNFIQFNHDILADEGLSKIDWGFSDIVKVDLLEVITDFGDNNSASTFLGTMLKREKQIFTNRKEKLLLINKLLAKNNSYYYYLISLIGMNLEDELIKEYAEKLWDKKIYVPAFWNFYAKTYKKDKLISKNISNILSVQQLLNFNPLFISIVLKNFADESLKLQFSDDILNERQWEDIPSAILIDCLIISKNEKLKQSFSNKILNDKNLRHISAEIICICLNYADEEIKQNFLNKVLNNKNWEKYNQAIINNCLNYVNEEIKQSFSDEVLNDKNWRHTSAEIICICLNYADEQIKIRFSNEVLNDENWKAISEQIINNCLKYADEEIKLRFSDDVLNDGNWTRIPYGTICSCLRISRNKEFALLTLKDWKRYDWRIVYNSLLCFEKEKHFSVIVNDVIKEIIYNHHNFKITLKGKSFQYANLLRINFKNHALWQREAIDIIKNWRKSRRDFVTNVLYSYRETPNIIESTCKYILMSWKIEINYSIPILFKKVHYGDHIKIALGHPSLRPQAKKTAINIISSIQDENFKVPEYLKEIAIQIVENDIYPEWKF